MEQKTDPRRMELTAKLAFKRVYPFIAQYVVHKYHVTEGLCLDIGSGPGSLAIAMAEITNLRTVALDVSHEMIEIARTNFSDKQLYRQIVPIVADVHEMPYPNDTFHLIVSRGSIFFWNDRVRAFKEIYRILRPGGVAFCGGGMGSDEIMREATSIIMTNDALEDFREVWLERTKSIDGNEDENQFRNDLKTAEIEGTLVRECKGVWVEIAKPRTGSKHSS